MKNIFYITLGMTLSLFFCYTVLPMKKVNIKKEVSNVSYYFVGKCFMLDKTLEGQHDGIVRDYLQNYSNMFPEMPEKECEAERGQKIQDCCARQEEETSVERTITFEDALNNFLQDDDPQEWFFSFFYPVKLVTKRKAEKCAHKIKHMIKYYETCIQECKKNKVQINRRSARDVEFCYTCAINRDLQDKREEALKMLERRNIN